MNRAGLAVILVAALSSAASAGTYLGLGIGTSPALSDEDVQAHHVAPDGGRSGKLIVGWRTGNFSLEGNLGGFTLLQENDGKFLPFGNAYQASASFKANLPLGNGFEAFGHVGLQHMWITDDKDDSFSGAGNGYLVGAGIEYHLNLGVGAGAIFIDYGLAKASLDGARRESTDVSTRIWTLGLTLGI